MAQSQWKTRLRQEAPQSRGEDETRRRVDDRIAWAAGTEAFSNRDPVYHVTESFRQMFDMMGTQRWGAGMQAQGNIFSTVMREAAPGLDQGPGLEDGGGEGEQTSPAANAYGEPADTAFMKKTSMAGSYRERGRQDGGRLLSRFSEVAFSRGTLAGAVLEGRGEMMLFSCLKRTVGQSQPKHERERLLFQSSSIHKRVAGASQSKVVFNRGFTDSAVGLVVNVLQNSRSTVDTLTALAEGRGGMGESNGAQTLRTMYPFLSDARERELLAEYKERLAAGIGGDEKMILQRAVAKTEALIDKKRQMKTEFTARLRQMSDSAAAAAAVFSQEEFRAALAARLTEEVPGDIPPDGDDGRDGDEAGDDGLADWERTV